MTRSRWTDRSPDPQERRGSRSLSDLVDQYLRRKDPCHDDELAWYQGMPSLEEAVRNAALCVTSEGKRHAHQRRIPQATLEEAAARLAEAGLGKALDFDDLHLRVRKACARIDKFGPLTTYDVAFRIGLYLKMLPVRVHLHAGTQAGARALGLSLDRPHLEMRELPAELHRLQPWQVEDFLCIYKDWLRPTRVSPGM